MAKRSKPAAEPAAPQALFPSPQSRRRSGLFLARFLAEEAESMLYRGKDQDHAHEVLKHWADLEEQGVLAQKETALDAGFLQEVFSDALGYQSVTQAPADYHLERNFGIPDIGVADAALGNFRQGERASPLVVIELKGARVNLDRDKFNGRTAVQQCWDYLNALPDCPWGIVSNFVTFRLYQRNKTPLAYEEFKLQELRDLRKFRQFYCVLERGGLVRPRFGQYLRAMHLLAKTENRQREVGDVLYNDYSANRIRLIEHLHYTLHKSLDEAIHIAQKLLDRIIFVAFCEDRGLLPEKCIDRAYSTLPPFSKVTNPRWRNFLNLFHAIDKGHPDFELTTGYNGGLFREDEAVDGLQLDDDWTNFFRAVGKYDFRDEVNVEVLGHIFEKSVAELEKLRLGGLFAVAGSGVANGGPAPAMRKSAERKRFGIYYTPPDFTRFIVRNTVAAVAEERLQAVRDAHGLTAEECQSEEPSAKLAAFWRDYFKSLRTIKVCDPACGSGAFLIQAYDVLETCYTRIVDQLAIHDPEAAEPLLEAVPEIILAENLYGVDVSPQAVEITQLALWVRSARRNRTLADLSHNILHGNSLVSDANVHEKAMQWESAFLQVFSRAENPGFDCVIGNPPWERMKLQEREFFAFSATRIAGAVSAARRRQLIEQLEKANPELHDRYRQAKQLAERTLTHVREAGNFPLTAKGDVNTYMVFAELARKIVAPNGRVGLLVPSGIATDHTTKEFFGELIESEALIALYDFENRKKLFADVDGRFKFSVLLFGGRDLKTPTVDFAFFAHQMDDLDDKDRHIALSRKDIALLNPNTHTCPVFRGRRDAELTKAIYRRVPVLIDKTRRKGGNPWGVKFVRMFDQTNDAELFRTREELVKMGCKQQDNRWLKGRQVFLPLYEAKMVQAYDHRAASVVIEAGNWVRQGQTDSTSLVGHQNPEFLAQPRWWVEEEAVVSALKVGLPQGFIGFKDITSPTNRRTMIAAAIPWSAVTNHFPLILTDTTDRLRLCLLANLNAFVLDYVARQKIGGVTLNFFIVEQLPIFPPDRYAERCPWDKRQTLEKWISDRVLKLTCTADDMQPLAEAASFDPPVHKWNPAERAELTAELDAAFFLLYGIGRDDAEYMLGTFRGIAPDGESPGGAAVAGGILDAYDRLA